MMNKKLLALLVAGAISLTGCNETTSSGEPTNNYEDAIKTSLARQSKVSFAVLGSDADIPLPSYLLMDTSDGTLNIPISAGQSTGLDNPQVAMGNTDGWSATQPYTINVKLKTGLAFNPATLADGVKVAKVTVTNGVMSNPELLVAGTDYRVVASGGTITVLPLSNKFQPNSEYIFALTDTLQDSEGVPLGMSETYATLKTKKYEQQGTLKTAQLITHQVEAIMLATQQVASTDNIIYSSWYTTASAGDVLYAAKSASALAIQNGAANIWKGTAVSDSVTSDDLNKAFTFTDIAQAGTTTANNLIYKGNVHLPYYLETSLTTFGSTPWQSGMPSLAKIKYALENGTAADKAGLLSQLNTLGITTEDLSKVSSDLATQKKVLTALTGQTLTLANGSQLDPERLITRYSPVPKLKSVEAVPFTLVLPGTGCNTTAINKVSIFSHGITGQKEHLTANTLADNLIGSNCQAIFAIDHPLHGERGLTLPNGNKMTAGTNPEIYLNLQALTVGRDNLRQSIIDIINLRASIGRVFAALAPAIASGDQATIDGLGVLGRLSPTSGVALTGHSLGAITGTAVANVANRSVDPTADALIFDINRVALASPGGSIPYLLLNSGSFGNFVKGNLVAATSSTFKQGCDAQGVNLETCYAGYEQGLINNNDAATLSGLYSSFTQFAYAAQTVLDAVDPISHAAQVSSNTAVYLNQVDNDQTIPNQLTFGDLVAPGIPVMKPYSAFAGTYPLVGLLGLTPVNSTQASANMIKNAVLFNAGGHNSLIDPSANSNVSTEMHNEISSLLNGDGKALTVDNTNNVIRLPN
ncbi:lipase [Vibrio sp. Of7-15]|uniref:VolA/Pla-1 family phospholipase n=1 Tax=Vibrio sp. Of7-15 TaxID=2724879 RepID=UPI001EF29379|nr:VolA/Pla-1 family phospholipase [Vibrio sp. Of7-15]MCG7495892.1 lipase [Vibrio sp. Of7-15]